MCPHEYLGSGIGPTVRLVRLLHGADNDGLWSPCCGTHVESVSELAATQIEKLQKKSGRVRVSYNLALP